MHHNDSGIGQFIFILIAIIVAILKSVSSKKGDQPSKPLDDRWISKPPQKPPVQRPIANRQQSEDERVKQFMDALGLPANTPPPVRRPVAQPPLTANSQRAVFQPNSPSVRAWQQREKELDAISKKWTAQLQQKSGVSDTKEPAASVESSLPPAPPTSPTPSGMSGSAQVVQRLVEREGKQIVAQPALPLAASGLDIRTLMRSRDGLRAAFLAQQIFGAPRGLQS